MTKPKKETANKQVPEDGQGTAGQELEAHEVAKAFPLLEGEEYERLKDNIEEYGLLQPIWTYQGKIIDGRNRYRACRELGVEPITKEWDGNGSLVAFVVGLNVHRRSLTTSQKAAIAVDLLPFLQQEAKVRKQAGTRADGSAGTNGTPSNLPQKVGEGQKRNRHDGEAATQAARIVGSNRTYVNEAKALKKSNPDLFKKVHLGELTLDEAKAQASPDADPKRKATKLRGAGNQKKAESGLAATVREQSTTTVRQTQTENGEPSPAESLPHPDPAIAPQDTPPPITSDPVAANSMPVVDHLTALDALNRAWERADNEARRQFLAQRLADPESQELVDELMVGIAIPTPDTASSTAPKRIAQRCPC